MSRSAFAIFTLLLATPAFAQQPSQQQAQAFQQQVATRIGALELEIMQRDALIQHLRGEKDQATADIKTAHDEAAKLRDDNIKVLKMLDQAQASDQAAMQSIVKERDALQEKLNAANKTRKHDGPEDKK